MSYMYETEKGIVVITDRHIIINDKEYNICSAQLTCGEYETWDMYETDKHLVLDPATEKTYMFTLYYNNDPELRYLEEVLHEDVYHYVYRLEQR